MQAAVMDAARFRNFVIRNRENKRREKLR